jgi:hypothetical protein
MAIAASAGMPALMLPVLMGCSQVHIRPIDEELEELNATVKQIFDEIDAGSDKIDQGAVNMHVGMHNNRLTAIIVNAAKVEFGMPARTQANRMVVRHFVVKKLKAIRDLRVTDANRIIDIAVELVFYPSRNEIKGKRLCMTDELQEFISVHNQADKAQKGSVGLFGDAD